MHRPARASLLVLLAAALTLVGCNSIGPGRTPSGTTATSRMDAAGVTRLDVAYGFDVRVSLGQPEAVTITYDDNLADLLDVRVDGRTLRFQLQPNSNIDNRPTLRAEVTMSRLEEIRAAGTSTVTVANKLPGSGLRLLVSGSSRVVADDLAVDRADATVSGSSRLELTGTANALSAQGSGASNLQADLHGHTPVHQAGHLGRRQHPTGLTQPQPSPPACVARDCCRHRAFVVSDEMACFAAWPSVTAREQLTMRR